MEQLPHHSSRYLSTYLAASIDYAFDLDQTYPESRVWHRKLASTEYRESQQQHPCTVCGQRDIETRVRWFVVLGRWLRDRICFACFHLEGDEPVCGSWAIDSSVRRK